jgi:two-component system, OmpR family, KDP operon response regulator KdpE
MSRVKRRILVVDDEPAVLRAIGVALESQGYDVHAATTGEQAVARAAASAPDLILLDLGLPGFDGLEVIRRVRAFLDSTPIIVLSAWGEDETKVRALDLGADDYVVKPFALPELLARVRVGLRHAEREASGARVEATRITRGPIEIDSASRQVRVRGELVVLTPTQYDLLLCFARHPGRVLTHRMIVAEVWGDPDASDAQNLRVFISQLRRKVEADPRRPELIVTDPGVGYRFLPGGAAEA